LTPNEQQLCQLREEIDRLFETPFADFSRMGEFFNGWAPPLDLAEDKDDLVATVEIPGLKKENLDVSVHEGVLSISGERERANEGETGEAHRRERVFGRFHRTISLPKPVRIDAIKATYRDGILTVTMPKTEEAKPRQIEVSIH
jgi:HSP20 family protein